jgi:hypothetical protein
MNLKPLALGAVLILGTAFAAADTIASSSTTTTFNGFIFSSVTPPVGAYPTPGSFPPSVPGTATFNLNPGTAWDAPFAGSSWVGSAATSGPVGTVNPQYGFYLYGVQLTESGTLTSLQVMADDTVSVFVGASDNIIAPGALGTDLHCADSAPSCTLLLQGTFSGSVPVTAGEFLWFVVEQAGIGPPGGTGDPSGVDFVATVNATTVPEPGSLMLLGTGLVGSAGMLLRRRRA